MLFPCRESTAPLPLKQELQVHFSAPETAGKTETSSFLPETHESRKLNKVLQTIYFSHLALFSVCRYRVSSYLGSDVLLGHLESVRTVCQNLTGN